MTLFRDIKKVILQIIKLFMWVCFSCNWLILRITEILDKNITKIINRIDSIL